MSKTVTLHGLPEILEALKKLPPEIGSKGGGPLKAALFKAASVIKQDAIARAPVDTGNLQQQIYVYRDRDPAASGATERYIIGVRTKRRSRKGKFGGSFGGNSTSKRSGDAFYWRFVEFGTEKMAARPFLRPAFESKKGEAVDTFTKELRTIVEKAAAKVAKRAVR